MPSEPLLGSKATISMDPILVHRRCHLRHLITIGVRKRLYRRRLDAMQSVSDNIQKTWNSSSRVFQNDQDDEDGSHRNSTS
jgi:hypothetical protein